MFALLGVVPPQHHWLAPCILSLHVPEFVGILFEQQIKAFGFTDQSIKASSWLKISELLKCGNIYNRIVDAQISFRFF